MTGRYAKLADYENNWVTSMGDFFSNPSDPLLRGRHELEDFESFSYTQFLLFALTGKNFTNEQLEFVTNCWKYSGIYAEPRLWNNRIAAICGTVRTTGALAITAGNCISESLYFGFKPMYRCAVALVYIGKMVQSGVSVEDAVADYISKYGKIGGYGRPLGLKGDERIEPLIRFTKKCNLADQFYFKLCFDIDQVLWQKKKLKMNVSPVLVSSLLDIGLTAHQVYLLLVPITFISGLEACYIDALNKSEGTFFPMRCASIAYEGPNKRKLPSSQLKSLMSAKQSAGETEDQKINTASDYT